VHGKVQSCESFQSVIKDFNLQKAICYDVYSLNVILTQVK